MKIPWRVVVLMVAFLLLVGMAGLSVVSILPERRVCFARHQSSPGSACVLVAVANTDGERQRGLAGVRWLPDMMGMLFVFDEARQHAFWMKGMRVPLDFVWMRDGVVVEVTETVYPEKVEGEQWTIYKPMVPVDMVLEVASGWVARRELEVGDSLFW